MSLMRRVALVSEIASGFEKSIEENMICSDGGLTIAGSDEMSNTAHDLAVCLNTILANRYVNQEEWKELFNTLAYPEDINQGNEIAQSIRANFDTEGFYF